MVTEMTNQLRALLKTEKLSKHFPRKTAFKTEVVKAVTEVSLDAFEGETLAIVGESGSGKTTFGKTAIRIYNLTQGRIWFDGEEITSINGEALRKYRKNMQMVFQDLVEIAETAELFENPLHPYTKALISAIPVVSADELKFIPEEITLEGEIPSPSNVPAYCKFFSRCQNRMGICRESEPELANITDNHLVRCYLYQ